jgi:pectinesterase
MALCSFRPLGLLLLTVFFAFVVSTRATAYGKSPVLAPMPPPAGSRFLWTCCANTTNASICYDSLLPFAGSFHGNRVRVARASSVIAFARLRGFNDELRRIQLQPGGTGAGRLADMAVGDCVTSADVALGREGDLMARLRRLETAAGRRRGKQAEEDLHEATLYAGSVESFTMWCLDDFASDGDASPVVKKVVAGATNLQLYGLIALDLVASIKLAM